jgi:hypothetical protein
MEVVRQSSSGRLGSSFQHSYPKPALTSNNDTNTNGGFSSTLDPVIDPYAVKSVASNRIKTAEKAISKRSSKSILMLRSIKGGARSSSRMRQDVSQKSFVGIGRKLS